ncbi:hypothetical protein DM01DRAFT_1051770 [Hesseltinella vesiculosa]|uniref:Dipeptidyl-peptidase IV n=1 Tax=Hesseltinella vesiculosa TaxID=101127 RepID=A0A1X2GHD7_9FUNG|nr:hypothetical protein DM01DRAFT_1051770 [Hesseltinella vesiculosa]
MILTSPPPPQNAQRGKTWLCFGFFVFLLSGWLIWLIVMQNLSPDATNEDETTVKHIDFNDIFNTDYTPKRPRITWANDGNLTGHIALLDRATNNLLVQHVDTKKAQLLVKGSQLVMNNRSLSIDHFSFSQDQKHILLSANASKVWQRSKVSTMYVYNRARQHLSLLLEPGVTVSFAQWSPTGRHIAYVRENNLYVTDLATHTQITHDGSDTVFNGIPDWVYEEELLNQDHALWWSPDGNRLAYLRLDASQVPVLHLPIYEESANDIYPSEQAIRYPKAGQANPMATLHVYSLETAIDSVVLGNATVAATLSPTNGQSQTDFDVDDRLVVDVAWMTDDSDVLLFKQTNRVQDLQITNIVQWHNGTNATLSTLSKDAPLDRGWLDQGMNMRFVSRTNDTLVFVDWLNNDQGYMHLAQLTLRLDEMAIDRVWLTSGPWEIQDRSVVVDPIRQKVYFISTERSPLERHLYMLSLATAEKTCMTCPDDIDLTAFYEATFSPDKSYYVLHYQGPDVPVTTIHHVDDSKIELTVQANDGLKQKLANFDLPTKRYVTITSGGRELHVEEQLPPGFDATQKYPVLFRVYGGPNSQSVTHEFQLDWHTFLSSKLQYIVVTVDGRGTGNRGRDFRMDVRGRLGTLEAVDQLNAARHWSQLKYVDASRISIWGWSFGGFLVAKCIEANQGIFKAGMAVAPVTDWRYYDSVYTERYMLTPDMNPEGYQRSAVTNMTGFANTKFLLVHGTADDNVHFQNTAILVDRLTRASIHSYRVQFYTDSNHFIEHHEANANMYYLLTDFLWERYDSSCFEPWLTPNLSRF